MKPLILHLLHLNGCVPSFDKEDDGYRVYKNAWHLLGITKSSKAIPKKFWNKHIEKMGLLPGYIISSWEGHPLLTFKNSHYSEEELNGRGDTIIIGSYNVMDEAMKVRSVGELYIHGLTTKDKADEILRQLKEAPPFEYVYIGDSIARVTWNVFNKIQAPRELNLEAK